MHIAIDIPNRYAKRNLYVFAGLEPVARRRKGQWEGKVADCSHCGNCCLRIREDHPLGTPDGCRHLMRGPGEQLCGLDIFRPYGCAIAEPAGIDSCTVRWEPVE